MGRPSDGKEYDCIDCGMHVHAFGAVRDDMLRCGPCQWLSELTDDETREKARAHMLERGVIGTGDAATKDDQA